MVEPASPRTRRRLFWQLQVGGWLLAIPFFTGIVMVVFSDPATALKVGVVRQFAGFIVTLGLWRIYRRWPAARFELAQRAWQIVLCCIAATGIDFLLGEAGRNLLSLPSLPETVLRGSLFLRFAVFGAWSALYFVIRQELESRETELRLARVEAVNREAELQLLRAQMNPHFIFNALNTIVAEAEENSAAVIATTHAVADYLRYSLSHRAHRAPLGDELDAMANYLRVERTHLGEQQFNWQITAAADARAALTPTAFVQPLIENAVKYGLRTSPPPLQLRVTATVLGNELSVVVENSGRWIQRRPGEETADSTGIGLANVRRRLVLLCGENARLDITSPDGFVRIEARLPLLTAEPPAESK
ncbi:MAG: histidine kinase [Opitutaceae bacterium]|nr:histidine kinase [Opitutaceae bacterium]